MFSMQLTYSPIGSSHAVCYACGPQTNYKNHHGVKDSFTAFFFFLTLFYAKPQLKDHEDSDVLNS